MGSTPPKSILVKVSSFYFVSSFLLLFLCVFPSFSSPFFSISVGPTTTTSLSAAAAGLGTWQMDQNGQNLNNTEFAAGHANISTSTRPTTRRQALLMNSTPSDTQVPPLDDNSPTPRPLRRQSFIASPGANLQRRARAVDRSATRAAMDAAAFLSTLPSSALPLLPSFPPQTHTAPTPRHALPPPSATTPPPPPPRTRPTRLSDACWRHCMWGRRSRPRFTESPSLPRR